MTKENSTKPAFVSEEAGRGDGFLAATHVWESSALPPWAAACFRADRWTEDGAYGNDCRRKENRQKDIMDLIGKQYSAFKDTGAFTERVFLIEGNYSYTFLSSHMQKQLQCSAYSQFSFSLSMNSNWWTPAYVCSHASDLALSLLFDQRSRRMRLLSSLFLATECPGRAIRVWPLPSAWLHETRTGS